MAVMKQAWSLLQLIRQTECRRGRAPSHSIVSRACRGPRSRLRASDGPPRVFLARDAGQPGRWCMAQSGRAAAHTTARHRLIADDSGLPSAVIRFRTRQARLASASRPPRLRARRSSPIRTCSNRDEGRVRRDAGDVANGRPNRIDTHGRIVDRRVGQHVRDDHDHAAASDRHATAPPAVHRRRAREPCTNAPPRLE
jgi:hypothetical protein